MEQLSDEPIKLGEITFSHKDNFAHDVKFDRLAHDGSTLTMVSLVVEPMRCKAIRAILHARSGVPLIKTKGVGTKFSGEDYPRIPHDLSPNSEGYSNYSHHLDFGLVHAMFVTRDEKFIRYMSPDAIWHKLKSDRYSTPIVREWMPYITEQLISRNLLRECMCYRLNCGVMSMSSDKHLDDIVSNGIKEGKIHIP